MTEDILKVVVAIGAAFVLSLLIFLSCSTKLETRGWVVTKSWIYTVTENERYTTIETKQVCDTKYNSDGTSQTICESKTELVTKTRVTNTWTSTGAYPQQPYWPSYHIMPGRYESKQENYFITFRCKEGDFVRYTSNRPEYDQYGIERIYALNINYFNAVIRAELIK